MALTQEREARAAERLPTRRDRTFSVVAAEYLDAKRRTHKRSVNGPMNGPIGLIPLPNRCK